MKVRKVVTRSGKKFRAKFPSRKNGRMVECESLLEKDAALVLEFTHEVAHYQEQPSVEIYYDTLFQPHRYVPDFLVTLHDGRQLTVEVKPAVHAAKKDVGDKLSAIATRFEEQGRSFRVWTESEIRQQPRFENLQILRSSGRRLESTLVLDELARRLHGAADLTVASAAERLGSLNLVHRLIAAQRLHVDLHAPITEQTLARLFIKEGANDATFCL